MNTFSLNKRHLDLLNDRQIELLSNIIDQQLYDLDLEQDTDLYNINMTYLQELQTARNTGDKNAMKQAHITKKNAIAATLTEEQMTALKNARSRNKEG